jgi:hypothetical protein
MYIDMIWIVATMWIIVIGSALFVYYDASKNKIADAGLWAIATFLFWILGFPVYLFKRSKLIEKAKIYPEEIKCPHCASSLKLTVADCQTRKFNCPKCAKEIVL